MATRTKKYRIPWQRCCANCIFSTKILGQTKLLVCKRYPPIHGTQDTVISTNWCGEFKLNPLLKKIKE